MINVEVVKNQNENTLSLIRRFSRRVQGAGIIPRVRGNRYQSRPASKFVQKKQALKRIKRREEIETLVKWGKMPEKPVRKRGRR